MRLTDFALDDATGIRLPATVGVPAGYLDGAERELAAALPAIGDRGTGSPELEALVHDWPTRYHLTPYRATIFDCLGFTRAATARVLELGAGCGAITRWLGEHCGEVHAIEGDLARARIARLRCADQDGVHLYAANYSELDERSAFDVVTLIGVLEYGHLYHPDHHGDPAAAALANLRIARQALRDDGVLVVAIENALGLKYLNGAREDHSGRLFDSIQGYPDRTVPVTFSRRELAGLLDAAGFAATRWYVAHPDYKLATTIVDAAATADDPYVHNWLDGPAPDRGAERGPLLFNERLAQRQMTRAGLTLDHANSFLAVAFPTDPAASAARLGLELDWGARHYSLDRRPCFRKRATLRGGDVLHEPAPFGPPGREAAQAEVRAHAGLRQALGSEPYARGDLLVHSVLEAVAAEGIGPRFAAHVAALRAWLVERYGLPAGDGEPQLLLPAAWDATWWNVVVDADDGSWRVVDEEWSFDFPLPADYVTWRCLHHFALRNRLQLPAPERGEDAYALAGRWLAAATGPLPPAVLAGFAELDRFIGLCAAPGPLPAAPPELHATLSALSAAPVRIVLADAEELAADGALLAAFLDRFGAADPVRLVLLAPGGEEDALAGALGAGPAGTRLAADGAADVVLTPAPDGAAGWAALADEALAFLSARPARPELAALPRYADDALDALAASVASP